MWAWNRQAVHFCNQPWLEFTGRKLEQELNGWRECMATTVRVYEGAGSHSMPETIRAIRRVVMMGSTAGSWTTAFRVLTRTKLFSATLARAWM
jgi:hypothetical protein